MFPKYLDILTSFYVYASWNDFGCIVVFYGDLAASKSYDCSFPQLPRPLALPTELLVELAVFSLTLLPSLNIRKVA